MAELDTIRAELEKLLEEVRDLQAGGKMSSDAAATATADAAPAETAEAAAKDDAEAMHELQQYLATKAGEAEEALEDHPLVALAAAFMLGLVAGRLAFR